MMSDPIMLVSTDESLAHTRALVLQSAGFQTITTTSLANATQFDGSLLIIDWTLSDCECQEFMKQLREAKPGLTVLLLDEILSDPEALIEAVTEHASNSVSSRSSANDEPVLRWPPKAS
jgi:DNA-binding response OmpR family regulator